MNSGFKMSTLCLAVALAGVEAQTTEAIIVTPDNDAEAEMDLTFASIVNEVGSNAFRRDRSPIPLDRQPAVTMNRDTIYSFGIFLVPKGTTITPPPSTDGRY